MSKAIYFERHREDDWIDAVTFTTAGGVEALRIETVPRFKTSGMSGDEWRISSRVTLRSVGGAEVGVLPYFHKVQHAVARVAGLLAEPDKEAPRAHMAPWFDAPGVLRLWRKGLVCLERHHPRMIDAAMTLPWTLYVGGEAPDWRSVETVGLCMQPGCAQPFTTEYRIRQRYTGPDAVPVPANEWGEYHRRFCARHATRGDAAYEDADANYVRVGGPAPEAPPAGDCREARLVTVSGEEFLSDPAGTLDAVRAAVARNGTGEPDA